MIIHAIVTTTAAAEQTPGAWADYPLAERVQLTGCWFGHRDTLTEKGVCVDPYLIFDTSHNLHGGADTEGSATRRLLSVNATFDLTTILGWSSGTVFVDFHQQHGQNGSDEVGDYQYVGNVDADGLTQVSELWFEYSFLDDTVRTKIGKVDANCEFGYSELSWQFVHGSASFPTTDALMPTYPDPATSVNVFVYPTDGLSFGVGVYDGSLQEGVRTGSRGPSTFFGDPADLYVVGEVGLNWTIGDKVMAGRAALGGWHHTGTFDRFDGGTDAGTSGFHVVLEQMVWTPDADNPDDPAGLYAPGLGVFFQYDWANPDVLDVEHHVNAGFTWRGLCPARVDDVVGVFVSWIRFSDQAGYMGDNETALELTYRAQVTPALVVQPYVQSITNPGGAGLNDAVNAGLRLEFYF